MSRKRSSSPKKTTTAIARLGLISTEIRDLARLEAIAAHIEWPLHKWPGNCYAVASAICESGLIDADPQYGHWRGPVAPRSMFFNTWCSFGWCNHGWAVTKKGKIFDPTRYVFECVPPYIYLGPNTHDYYDAGGNFLREAIERPMPEYKESAQQVTLDIPQATAVWLRKKLGRGNPYSFDQMIWLANLSLTKLGKHARPIYRAIIDAGFRALLPWDNREIVLGKK